MDINIVLPSISRAPIGGHKVIYEYSNLLHRQGHKVNVYYFYGNRLKTKHMPEMVRKTILRVYGRIVGPREWFPLERKIVTRVIGDIREVRNADVLIATGISTAIPVSRADSKKGKKAYFIQDFENWSYSDEEVYNTYSLGMNNIVVSKWLKYIVDQYSKSPSVLVSNGIDNTIFYDMHMKRKKHSIMFHYRKAPQKGCQYACDVISELRKIYSDLDVTVVSNEKQPDEFIECTYYRNISAKKVAELNNKTEVFICTTIDEGFGLPGLEAMACGCALASTEYIGSKEYAINGYNSLLSPVRDVVAMASNVVKLFEEQSLYETISRNGIETGKEHSINESFEKFQEALLAKK